MFSRRAPIRDQVAVLLGVGALSFPAVSSAAALSTQQGQRVVVQKVRGASAEADRWGSVQVTITERTSTAASSKRVARRYTELGGSYTYHTDRSRYIMSQALPLLRQEFLAAQSDDVQVISGATDTSEAFVHSLQSALLKAHG